MAELYSLHRLTLDAPGKHLFAALAEAVPGMSRRQAREAIVAGLVKVGGDLVLQPKQLLSERVAVVCDLRHGINKIRKAQKFGGAGPALERPFTILHEDEDLVVVDKAAGVLSAPTESGEHGHVPELLRKYWSSKGRDVRFIGLIHRLDKETSGCLCFALTREAQRLCAAQFAAHSATRAYRCLVIGAPRRDKDRIVGKIGRGHDGRRAVVQEDEPGKDAVTNYTVLNRYRLGCELEAQLETGRTHQIRVHLAQIGCPVYGDRVYARHLPRHLLAKARDLPKPPRMMLHAITLSLDHPTNGRRLVVTAPKPAVFGEFAKLLA
jgi:23S rRNA pseudouridine1911/1915/1917 synthase